MRGTLGIVWMARFVFNHPKKKEKKKETFVWLIPVSCKHSQWRGENEVSQIINRQIRHLISLGFY